MGRGKMIHFPKKLFIFETVNLASSGLEWKMPTDINLILGDNIYNTLLHNMILIKHLEIFWFSVKKILNLVILLIFGQNNDIF